MNQTQTRKLPADVSRCLGKHGVGKSLTTCPVRETCLRFISPPHEEPMQQRWIMPEKYEMTEDCPHRKEL